MIPRPRPMQAAAALLLLTVLASGCFGPPQMGPDREAFKAIDALYTAVSLREPVHVDRCSDRLSELREAGKLPSSAHDALAAIIAEAKGGRWEQAQASLREFMLGQRRSRAMTGACDGADPVDDLRRGRGADSRDPPRRACRAARRVIPPLPGRLLPGGGPEKRTASSTMWPANNAGNRLGLRRRPGFDCRP